MSRIKPVSSGPLPPPRDRFFRSDGLTLHYGEWGDPTRETFILVHGNRDQCRSWDFFVNAQFGQDHQGAHVVALDLRGHGDSDWSVPERGYQHGDFILDLAGLLRHLKKESVTLIGHSLGGSVSMLFAGAFPRKVRRLVLIEATGPFARSDREVPELLAQWLEGRNAPAEPSLYRTLEDAELAIQRRFPLIPGEARLHMARHGTRPDGRGYVWKYDPRVRFHSYSNFTEGQIQAFIERILCPTLLIFGGKGGFAKSPRFSRVRLFRNAKVVEIADSGHHIPHEKPRELARAVSAFLRS